MALIGIGTVLSVSACGGKENTTSNEPQTTANVAESEAKTEIKVALWDYTNAKYYKNLIEEFEKNNEDISVKVIEISADEYNDKIQIMLSGGDDVDVVFTKEVASLAGLIQKGQVLSLDDYIQKANIDESYYGGMLNELALDGKVYAMPFKKDCTILYYNKDLFDKAGVEIPATIEDLYKVCDTLKAADITPFTFPDKDVWTVRQFCDRASVTMLEDPVGLFEDIAAGGTTAADSKELRQMGETIVKLRQYGQEDNLGTGQEQAIADFANGKAAMFFSGTFAYPEIVKSNPDLQFAMFRYPSFNGSSIDRLGVNIDTAFSISAATKYPEAAKRFVEYCTSPENAQQFSDYDGTPSAIKGVNFNKTEFESMFKDYVQTGKTMSVPSNSWPPSFGGEYGNICQELIDTKDVDQWLDNLNQLIMDTYNN